MRKTPLHGVHRESGAKMVPFGGWDMPVSYSGTIAEHLAVRKAAGLFDVSHMGEFEFEGSSALSFLQRVTSNNVAKLVDGQAQYSALTLPNGAPVDDVILYRRGEARYLMVVNAGNRDKAWQWLEGQKPAAGVALRDRSDEFALLALQGPRAQEILQRLTPLDLPKVPFYHFAEGRVAEAAAIVARTGYTGEDGFELFFASEKAELVWRRLIEAGKEAGLLPAGLGARDTLRLEAKMCLYGNDMDETTTLVEAGLGWIVSADAAKGDFIGAGVLLAQKQGGAPRKLIGFEMAGQGIARHGYAVSLEGSEVGKVCSGSFAPFLQKNIGLTYLPTAKSGVGTELAVDVRGRAVEARVVPTPFYKRPR
ncbi:MAG TPA: glycine cleavage system aminomethyltransferase GcvT [Vicinamibacteria bacterium]